jgi:hypothetical protein
MMRQRAEEGNVKRQKGLASAAQKLASDEKKARAAAETEKEEEAGLRARAVEAQCESPCVLSFVLHVSGLRAPLLLSRPLHSPVGRDHRSRTRSAASGPSVCPSQDFWASIRAYAWDGGTYTRPRTRPAAAAGALRAALPSPTAAPTTTQPLALAWRPFPPFSRILRPFVSRFSPLRVASLQASEWLRRLSWQPWRRWRRQEQQGGRRQPGRRRRRRFRRRSGQQWQPGRRFFASFRLFAVAAQQQQQQLQRQLRGCSGASSGLGGSAEAPAVKEPLCRHDQGVVGSRAQKRFTSSSRKWSAWM